MGRIRMRRFLPTVLVFVCAISLGVNGGPCRTRHNQRGRCINLYQCVPGFNAMKNNDATPELGDCPRDSPEDTICCVEDTRGLKIHEKRCLEYFLYAFEDRYRPPEDPEDDWEIFKQDMCKISPTPFIVGGELAAAHEFPHMAAIGDNSTDPILWFCGGSLISDTYVLTAAHCFIKRLVARVVRLGINHLIDDAPVDLWVTRIIRHPGYNERRAYNDIALIQLASRVTLGPHIKPACLPSETIDAVAITKLLATGWGNTEYKGTRSNALQKVIIDVHDHADCKEIYGKKFNELPQGVNENHICLLDPMRKKDTCQGDSGGPIQSVSKKVYCSYVVYGVTSVGIGCADQRGLPTLYTSVYPYIDWISSIVWR